MNFAPTQDAPGTLFGKFLLLKKLAAGGMGEIFLAKQQGPAGFEKVLVVKKILPHLTENRDFVEAFLGEARLAARMNHRNIVQVFDLGEHDGTFFIAMEYVQGKPLREVIDTAAKRRERIHPELARSIAEQICDGASYAHNLTDIQGRPLNLVHRDLNPQNVLISYGGDVKIIDFGIAKSDISTVKTEAGMIKGKFVYMSPEQSLARKLDKRSDVFAIGVSLYEMLTGANPFQKNNIVSTLEAIQRHDPPPPGEHDPAIAPFDRVVARALAKDRDRRYADAADMQDDLRRVMLPRPAERLGQFMSRLFRAQFDEEQRLLMDSDSARVTPPGPPRRTPPLAATVTPQPTLPEAPPPENATMMLPNAASRKTPPRARAVGAERAPVSPPRKPEGDTLIDLSDETLPEEETADETGLQARDEPTPPLPKARPPQPRPPAHDLADDSAGGTLPVVPAPVVRPPQQKPPRKNGARPRTDILTPEQSAHAQEQAARKLEQARQQVVRTRTRQDAAAHPPDGKKLWIAVGIGGLIAVVGLVALLFILLAEDSPSPRRPRRTAREPAPVEQRASPVRPGGAPR